MKKLILLSVVLCTLTAVSSCQKEETLAEPEKTDLFKLTDNGQTYETWNVIKRHEKGFIAAGAPNSFTSAYGIAMPEGIEPGAYNLGPATLVQVTKTENSGSVTYMPQSGTFTVTAHDKAAHYIAGTFSAILTHEGTGQTRTITGGEFKLNYP